MWSGQKSKILLLFWIDSTLSSTVGSGLAKNGRREVIMSQTLPISEVKARLPELVTGVEEREEEIVVTRKGKPAAVLVNFAEYERLKETLDVLSDPELMRQIQKSQKFYAEGGKSESFEDVFGEPLLPDKKRPDK